jgi:hypothetical protein
MRPNERPTRDAYLKRCGSSGFRKIPGLVRKMEALREELLDFPEGDTPDYVAEAFQALSFLLLTVASLADSIALPTPERAQRRFRRFDARNAG